MLIKFGSTWIRPEDVLRCRVEDYKNYDTDTMEWFAVIYFKVREGREHYNENNYREKVGIRKEAEEFVESFSRELQAMEWRAWLAEIPSFDGTGSPPPSGSPTNPLDIQKMIDEWIKGERGGPFVLPQGYEVMSAEVTIINAWAKAASADRIVDESKRREFICDWMSNDANRLLGMADKEEKLALSEKLETKFDGRRIDAAVFRRAAAMLLAATSLLAANKHG